MTQLMLSGKRLTELERLKQLRKQYYNELIIELEYLRTKRNRLILEYKLTILNLDKEINKENKKTPEVSEVEKWLT